MKTLNIIVDIISLLILLCVCVLLGSLISDAIKQNDIANCQKYQSYSETYPDFYITKDQKTICDFVGVQVFAEVK